MRVIWALMALLVVLVAGCASPQDTGNGNNQNARPVPTLNVAENDVVGEMLLGNATSTDFSVMGVALGGSRQQVIQKLGSPYNFTRFEGEGLLIENLEYGESLGFDGIGLIIHLENNEVTRMTMRESFSGFMKDSSVFGMDADDIYFEYGIPDEREIVFKFIALKYNEEGLELVTRLGKVVSIGLVSPSETDRNITTVRDLRYIPYSDEIVFT